MLRNFKMGLSFHSSEEKFQLLVLNDEYSLKLEVIKTNISICSTNTTESLSNFCCNFLVTGHATCRILGLILSLFFDVCRFESTYYHFRGSLCRRNFEETFSTWLQKTGLCLHMSRKVAIK